MLLLRPSLIGSASAVAMALVVASGLAVAQTAPEPPPAGPGAPIARVALEQLEVELDDAVAQVSRPSAGLVVGRMEGARGYQLPGYGAVFVLAPRSLPHAHREVVFWSRTVLPPGAQDVAVEPDEQDLLLAPPSPDATAPAPRPPKTKGRRIAPLDPAQTRELAEIEAQVQAFQREAEEARQAAERDLDRLTREFQVMLAPPSPPGVRAPAPPAPPAPATRVAVDAPPTPQPPLAPVPPLPPPWRFWFDAREAQDERPPERVVADVRAAVVNALEAHGPELRGLRPEEFISVAVDFLPGGMFVAQARPTQTIVVRARVRDLDERAKGQLSPDELRGRIEVVQY